MRLDWDRYPVQVPRKEYEMEDSETTPKQYQNFGAAVAGVMDGYVQRQGEKGMENLAVSTILTLASLYGISFK